jgi:hypothetical protein
MPLTTTYMKYVTHCKLDWVKLIYDRKRRENNYWDTEYERYICTGTISTNKILGQRGEILWLKLTKCFPEHVPLVAIIIHKMVLVPFSSTSEKLHFNLIVYLQILVDVWFALWLFCFRVPLASFGLTSRRYCAGRCWWISQHKRWSLEQQPPTLTRNDDRGDCLLSIC